MKKISIINDEISDNIKEVVKFLKKNKLRYVELRSIDKKNISDLDFSKVEKLATYLKRNNIKVSCLASPILKWYPNKSKEINNKQVDSFYFNDNFELERIFQLAKIFNTKYIRIFSFLKYNGFKLSDLKDEINILLQLAKKYNKILLIENEPVCNIDDIKKLEKFVKYFDDDRIKILFDPGNLYKQGDAIDYKDLSKIKKKIAYIHIKDFSKDLNKYVCLGDGVINYKKLLSFFVDSNFFYSFETHAGAENKIKNSRVSINNFFKILKSKRTKYGIVGCGRVFGKHALSINEDPNSELTAVYDIKQNRMKAKANENGCEYCDSLDELIDKADIINICTPHHTHTEIISTILKKNKKCLCEKPSSITSTDIRKVKRNKNYKNNIFVIFQNRFNKPILEMKNIIAKNNLGKLLYISGNVRWYRDKNYYKNTWQGKKKFEGGMLYNQGIHLIDIILDNLDGKSKINIINSYKDRLYHKNIDTEDIFLAQFKSGGSLCNVEVGVAVSPKNMGSDLLFIFENGRIEIGGIALNGYIKVVEAGKEDVMIDYSNIDKDVYGYGHKILIKELSEYLLTGKRHEELVDFDTAAKRIEFINNLYKYAKK